MIVHSELKELIIDLERLYPLSHTKDRHGRCTGCNRDFHEINHNGHSQNCHWLIGRKSLEPLRYLLYSMENGYKG